MMISLPRDLARPLGCLVGINYLIQKFTQRHFIELSYTQVGGTKTWIFGKCLWNPKTLLLKGGEGVMSASPIKQ